MAVTNGWSWRLRPTPGQLVADLHAGRRAAPRGAPMPDSSSSCGEPIAPADSSTSRSARTSSTPPRPLRRRTPTARSPSSSTPSTVTFVRTSRFGRVERRAQVGVGGAEARAVLLRHLEHRRAVLLGAVVVGDARDAGRLAGGEQAPAHRPRRALLGDVQRPAGAVVLGRAAHVVLGLDEVREHVRIAPAGRALRLPAVVVERAAADVEHRVHRARAAERLAARDVQRATVDVRLGLGREVPVELGVELFGERRRDLDLQRAVLAAGLEQQHAHGRVLGQAVGQHAAGGAGADDYVVVHRLAALLGTLGTHDGRWLRRAPRSWYSAASSCVGLLEVLAHVARPVGDDPAVLVAIPGVALASTRCRRSAPAARGRSRPRPRRAPRSRRRRGRAAAASAWRM